MKHSVPAPLADMPLGEPLIDAEEAAVPPAPATPVKGPLARILLGAGLVLVAANLRPVFPSLSAVLPDAVRDLSLSPVFASVVTTLPVACMGIFAPLAPWLARRFGAERTILGMMLLLALGTGLRGIESGWALLVGSVVAGGCIAIGNVLLPGLVKRDFPDRAALMTGLFTMALCGGAAIAAGVTSPLQHGLGSWSQALAAWAVPAGLVALLWIAPARADTGHRVVRPAVRGLWGKPLAWQVTLFMGLQSALAYCVFGWLAPILRDRGMDAVEAGIVVSMSVLVQTVSCLAAPSIAVRGRDQRPAAVGFLACAVIGFLGLLFAPIWSVWVWAVLQGIGQGSLIAVAMTIIVLRSPDAHVAAQLSSMAQTVGYVLAAGGPLLIGLIHALTGGFAASGILVLLLGLGAGAAGWGAGRAVLLDVASDPAA